MRYFSLSILVLLMLSAGCSFSTKKRPNVTLKGQDERVQQLIPKVLDEKRLMAVTGFPNVDTAVRPFLEAFYDSIDDAPMWTEQGKLSKDGKELVSLFTTSMNYGLDSTLYKGHFFASVFPTDSTKLDENKAAQIDVALTYYALLFCTHLSVGQIDSATFKPAFKGARMKVDLVDYIQSAVEDKNFKQRILALQPSFNEYKLLQKGLEHFMETHSQLVDDSIEIPDYKTDSVASFKMVKQILVARRYLDTADAGDNKKYIAALKKFQSERYLEADGKPGKNTRIALSTSDYDLYCQAAASMERWRWETDMSPNRAWVNLPAFHLKIVDADTVVRIHRVIVGKPETPSPEVSSRISYFILNPNWSVPFSIATKELLPHVQKDVSYLENKHYRVFDKNNKEVDPKKIDWKKMSKKNFGYTIKRDPGDFNDLGFIKFIFSNPYSIYLHDTNNRNLFTKDVRGLSHGCIRLDQPFDFADYLLQRDSSKIDIDSVKAIQESGVQKTIMLKHPLPIYTRYLTTEGDTGSRLNFYQDMYGRDQKIKANMLKKQSKPAV